MPDLRDDRYFLLHQHDSNKVVAHRIIANESHTSLADITGDGTKRFPVRAKVVVQRLNANRESGGRSSVFSTRVDGVDDLFH